MRALDPELPIFAVRTMDDAMAATVEERHFAMQLLALFAVAALALSAVGIYGVIAYGVAQRTREIGIRMALGARPADVRRMLLVEGGKLAGAGVAIGLAGSVLLTRAMSALLYGVGPRDPDDPGLGPGRAGGRRPGGHVLPGPTREPGRPDDRAAKRIA